MSSNENRKQSSTEGLQRWVWALLVCGIGCGAKGGDEHAPTRSSFGSVASSLVGTCVPNADGAGCTDGNACTAPGVSCGDTNACNGVETCNATGACVAVSNPTCFADVPLGHLSNLSLLIDVWGASTGDVYVTGYGGMVLHRAASGVVSSQQIPASANLGRIWGTSATNVYTVNADKVLHLNETGSWGAQATGATGELLAVWGSSATDLYAVGKNAGIFHSTGDQVWTRQTNHPLPADAQINAVRGSGPDNIFAVGSYADGTGFIIHRGAGEWQAQSPPPNTAGLTNLWVNGPNDVYVVGQVGTILHTTSDGTWIRQVSGVPGPLGGIWAPAAGTPIYVGGQGGIVLRSHGNGAWLPIVSPAAAAAGEVLNGLWGDSANSVWAAGFDVGNPIPGGYPPILRHIAADGAGCGGWDESTPNSCTVDSCDPATGLVTHMNLPNATACDDGNPCTLTDSCQDGTCTGSTPVVCADAGGDQCHGSASCDPFTGLCINLPVPNGFGCNDGDSCTQADACQNGTCVGADPVVCASLDQCHLPGSCDPGTGVCTNPPVPDGTLCDDGSACTAAESCQAGSCAGGDSTCPLVEASPDEPITMARFEELGFFIADEDEVFPTGINNAGDVVGWERHPTGRQTWAWRYTAQGVRYTTISPLSGSRAYGINAAGDIVGEVDLTSNPIGIQTIGTFPNESSFSNGKAFLESATGAFSILSDLRPGRASGINDHGYIAANAFLGSGLAVAALVTPFLDNEAPAVGRFSDSRFTGSMLAHGIGPGFNPELVGAAETRGSMPRLPFDVPGDDWQLPVLQSDAIVSEAFSFSEARGLQNLNELGAYTTVAWTLQAAMATNGKQIVGWGSFAEGGLLNCRAFRFNRLASPGSIVGPTPPPPVPGAPPRDGPQRDSITDLGFLPNYGSGNCDHNPYRARAINTRGEVVGDVIPSALARPGGAFFYSDATGMIDLTQVIDPALGYAIRTATGINDSGQIVGTFTRSGDATVRGYRLTLPPTFTSGPVAQFDWRMQPHFTGLDFSSPLDFSILTPTTCDQGVPCTDLQGNPGCQVMEGPGYKCQVTTCQAGAITSCRTACGSIGTRVCSEGLWNACSSSYDSYEVCDGQDNDCDGSIDEENVCVTPRSAWKSDHAYGFDTWLVSVSQSPKSPIVSCSWDIEVAPGEHQPASGCVAQFTFPREDVFPVTLTVVAANGTQAKETHKVTIKNHVIASLGDSSASGEGNPDIDGKPTVFHGSSFKSVSPGSPPVWWNRRCHRSLRSGAALAARALEEADPRSSVTFVALGCSGATTVNGLTGPYNGQEPSYVTPGENDRDGLLPSQVSVLRERLGTRSADALMLQIGINDADFVSPVGACTHGEGIPLFVENAAGVLMPSRMACENAQARANERAAALASELNPALDPPLISYQGLVPLVGDGSRIYIPDYPDPTHPTSLDDYCSEIRLVGAAHHRAGAASFLLNPLTGGLTISFFNPKTGKTSAQVLPHGPDGIIDEIDVRWASGFLAVLNGSIRAATVRNGWTHVGDVNSAFVGKALCQPTRAFVQYDESLIKQGNEKGVLHPNGVGHLIYASKFCPIIARDLGLPTRSCPATP